MNAEEFDAAKRQLLLEMNDAINVLKNEYEAKIERLRPEPRPAYPLAQPNKLVNLVVDTAQNVVFGLDVTGNAADYWRQRILLALQFTQNMPLEFLKTVEPAEHYSVGQGFKQGDSDGII